MRDCAPGYACVCTQAASQRCDEIIASLLAVSEKHCKDFSGEDIRPTPPTAVVLCSAATGAALSPWARESAPDVAAHMLPHAFRGIMSHLTCGSFCALLLLWGVGFPLLIFPCPCLALHPHASPAPLPAPRSCCSVLPYPRPLQEAAARTQQKCMAGVWV